MILCTFRFADRVCSREKTDPIHDLLSGSAPEFLYEHEFVTDARPGVPCGRKVGAFECLNEADAGIHLPADQCPDEPCETPKQHHTYLPMW